MNGKLTIFSKAVSLLILLLTPVLILYIYTNKVSVDVVKDEIQSSSLSQLSFFLHQFDTTAEQLAMFPVIASSDPYVRDFVDMRSDNNQYEWIREKNRVAEVLSLQSVSSAWTNDLTLYLPLENAIVSSNPVNSTDVQTFLSFRPSPGMWTFDPTVRPDARPPGPRFVRQLVNPYNAKSFDQIKSMIQISFSVSNMTAMLDQVKSGGKGDPFFYRAGLPPIGSSTMDSGVVSGLVPILGGQRLAESGSFVCQLGGRQYYVFYVQSKQLDWYLIDYAPVENILLPITKTNALFYVTIGLLLALGFLSAYLLYRHVQRPIGKLIQGVQRIKKGDLSARIRYRPNNEFDFLIVRFNEMAEQIQDLVERVYVEKIRLNDATLKQLQAQINPHFLYNSLFFVINMAMLGDTRSVVAMAQNLAEYYRYTTRMENQTAPLREELHLVENYLTIHNLRLQRFHYEIDVPGPMMDLQVPRLLLQPIVENAIEHGVESQPDDALIVISGRQDEEWNEIVVEDSGAGVSDEALRELEKQLYRPMEASMGYGVWNVHHRLQYAFGEGARVQLAHSALGGLKVTLSWKRRDDNDAAADRG
ncbi:histidine kinase [Gordoniibacillus kamchatkensis]|uniref:Histidine kinase n=1 Tax=Gordoniibacillus kamchatkensis TaxID=1590651 RepID=A0ABR5AM11_9BACL|nr:sensor histidine kinase [Paenibacillus sp. VKM B-2647]KIL41991.1 histidine kinase [Paenibacillus sp. VKM B-2647]